MKTLRNNKRTVIAGIILITGIYCAFNYSSVIAKAATKYIITNYSKVVQGNAKVTFYTDTNGHIYDVNIENTKNIPFVNKEIIRRMRKLSESTHNPLNDSTFIENIPPFKTEMNITYKITVLN